MIIIGQVKKREPLRDRKRERETEREKERERKRERERERESGGDNTVKTQVKELYTFKFCDRWI